MKTLDDYAPLEVCRKLYSMSGWLTGKVWLRSKNGWAVELASDYMKDPSAWMEWGSPAYTVAELTGKLASQGQTKDMPTDTEAICLYAYDLFTQNKLVPSKEG